ncbi:MAG: ATP-binding protein [Polyangiaceae bacterium]
MTVATLEKVNVTAITQTGGTSAPSLIGEAAFLSTPAITLRWLLRMRWGAVIGQAATILGTLLLFRLPLPLVALAVIILVTAMSNVVLQRWMRSTRSVSSRLVAAVLAFDTLSLGALLYFTGGPSNPFSVLFLVQITIAALVLGTGTTAAIVMLSAAAYAFLFFANVPLAGMEHMHHSGTSAFNLHLQGMFVAFTLAAVLIAYFVTRVSGALRQRDAQLEGAQRLAATNERLASLSTLAAGAAHELGTPLATIAIASKELERAAQLLSGADALREDAVLIRREVDRCRDIVQQMSAQAGGAAGEVPEKTDAKAIALELRRRLDEARSARLDVRADASTAFVVPSRALVQTLGSLVKNAFEATSDATAHVVLAIDSAGDRIRFSVMDEGTGMTAEELAHVGEPFFTTKDPGAGMGLGVFLARAFADRLGGTLAFASTSPRGTKVVLEIPMREK